MGVGRETFDVAVIGGGLAGWRAAEAAVGRGASVCLVANGAGNSPHIHALNCPVLDEDSVELHVRDTLASGHGTNDPALVTALCEGAARLKDEFAFDREPSGGYRLLKPLGSSVPRCVTMGPAIGAEILKRIKAKLAGRVKVVEGTVEGLSGSDGSAFSAGRGRPAHEANGALSCESAVLNRGQGALALPNNFFTLSVRRTSSTIPAPRFPGDDPTALSHITVGQGEELPHWTLSNAVYHVCFRLADALPSQPIDEQGPLAEVLDSGHGACLLLRTEIVQVVLQTIVHDVGRKYALHAIGIMPNHVHLLLQMAADCELCQTVQAIKSVSAHKIKCLAEVEGAVWQSDYYNRIVRTRSEYDSQSRYVGFTNAGVFGWRRASVGHGVSAWDGENLVRLAERLVSMAGRGRPAHEAHQPCQREILFAVDGLLRGLSGEAFTLHARAVVLATGGWCGKYDFSTNPPYLKGDGIRLGEGLGAAVVDRDLVQYEPTAALEPTALRGVPVITTMLFEGATFRNARGEEFLAENRLNKDELSRAIRAEIAAGRGVRGGVWYDATHVPRALLETRYAPLVRRYADVGVDITRDWMLVAPAPHTSLGGLRIDTRCRVLDAAGGAIGGLFAAGEVTGGVHGANRLGGNAGTEALVFGRIAGESAAASASEISKGDNRQ